jgi:hypothetical protein
MRNLSLVDGLTAEIIVSVLTDKIHAPRRAINTVRAFAAEGLLKGFLYDTRFDNHSIHPPKIAIARPAYRFTLCVVSGAE